MKSNWEIQLEKIFKIDLKYNKSLFITFINKNNSKIFLDVIGKCIDVFLIEEENKLKKKEENIMNLIIYNASRGPRPNYWTEQETKQLVMMKHDGQNYTTISSFIEGKTPENCVTRWNYLIRKYKTKEKIFNLFINGGGDSMLLLKDALLTIVDT